MKKLLLVFSSLLVLFNSFGFSSGKIPGGKAADMFMTIGKNGEQISLAELSTISLSAYQRISGKHLNIFQKLEFKHAQRNLRKGIHPDGSIDEKTANKFFSDGDHSTGFHVGGFLLGLTVIGVIFAYVLPAADDETKRNRVRWAWRGALFAITLASTLILSNAGVY